MTRPVVPSPPPLWYLMQARARRHLVRGPDAVAWQARCPHGAEGEWIAHLVGESVDITVHCDCEEAA